MYNESQKYDFINIVFPEGAERRNCIYLFRKLGRKVESQFDKDFSELAYEDAKLGITLLGGRDIKTVSWNLSHLKIYYNWCIENGKTSKTENPLLLIKPEDIDNSYIYKYEMIKDPVHLQYTLDIVYPDEKEQTVDNVYRLYIWLMYSGLTPMEAVYLKKDNVDLDKKLININGKSIIINNKMMELFDYINLEKYVLFRKDGNVVNMRFCISDYVLRTCRPTTINRDIRFGVKITDFNQDYKRYTDKYIKWSPNRIYDSGIFYRWYQLEQQKIKIPFDDHAKEKMQNTKTNSKYVYNRTLKDIKSNYSSWKKAFDL